MKKIERLEIENQVLKNVIACALEGIEIGKRTGEEEYLTLAGVKAKLDCEDKIQYALEEGEVIDYRHSSKTLYGCEFQLEIENQVLKNVIACALEGIEIGKRTGEEEYLTLAGVKAKLDCEDKIQYALEKGEVIDYRHSSKTLYGCEFQFKKFGSRVILNDGMVMGFEYY